MEQEQIELVIRLNKEDYDELCEDGFNGYSYQRNNVVKAISNGTLLPKGHGRLVDVDKLIADFVDSKAISIAERFKISNIIEHQKIIIEADKEGAE